jgi:methylenetetrahydrofolate reductase (NADPH)
LGEPDGLAGAGGFCLGAVASPYADPLELQIARLQKKAQAGARFLVTQPVYDVDRFNAWWQEVTRRGIHTKVAILAGIEPLSAQTLAKVEAGKRPSPKIPAAMLQRMKSKNDAVAIALETIQQLTKSCAGLRGFSVSAEGDFEAALQVVEKSGLGSN